MHRRVSKLDAVALVLVFGSMAASCGGNEDRAERSSSTSPSVSPTASASPSPTCDERARATVHLVAKGTDFNVECLVFPANERITVELENQPYLGGFGSNHNFSVYTAEFAREFKGEIVHPNERATYRVPPLEPGAYLFQCDIHPGAMSGPLIVR